MKNNVKQKKVAEKFGSFNFISYFCPRHPLIAFMVSVESVRCFGCLYLWKSVHSLCSDIAKSGKFQVSSEQSQRWMLMQVVYTKLFFCIFVLYAFIQGVLMICILNIVYTRIAWVLRCLFKDTGFTRASQYGIDKCQVPRFFHL